MIIELTRDQNFEDLVKNGVSIVDFSATWCGPCKMLHPVFENVSNELTDVKFISVDVDEFQQLSGKFSIRAVPTLILLVDGKPKNATTGYMDETALKHFIQNNL